MTFPESWAYVDDLQFSPDGHLLASGQITGNGWIRYGGIDDVRLWDPKTATVVSRFQASGSPFGFSSDGHRFATMISSFDPTIQIWSLEPATHPVERVTLRPWEHPLRYALSPDGTSLITTSLDSLIHWDLDTRQERWRTLECQRVHDIFAVSRIKFSPQGDTFVSESGPPVLWDTRTGLPIRRFSRDEEGESRYASPTCLDIRPDGRILATADDRRITMWDMTNGKPMMTLPNAHGRILCIRFSPDGRILASSGNDGTILLWDVKHLP